MPRTRIKVRSTRAKKVVKVLLHEMNGKCEGMWYIPQTNGSRLTVLHCNTTVFFHRTNGCVYHLATGGIPKYAC